jgi:5-methylcytosine-specific restriction endonuclease McrA
MKTKKPNAERVWKQLEDELAPRLRLTTGERTIYAHLLRHSRLEGKLCVQFSIRGLACRVRQNDGRVRAAVRHLAELNVLQIVQRSKAGHLVEVRLPEEISGAKLKPIANLAAAKEESARTRRPVDLESVDFMTSKRLRDSIHARDGERCFYCLRSTPASLRCLDHVVPKAQMGDGSYRNLVSSCMECNVQKGEKPADCFLRSLYRERRLTSAELAARLGALDDLAEGMLRPHLPSV